MAVVKFKAKAKRAIAEALRDGYEKFGPINETTSPIKTPKKFADSDFSLTFAPSVPAKPLMDAQMRGAFYFNAYRYGQTTFYKTVPFVPSHL